MTATERPRPTRPRSCFGPSRRLRPARTARGGRVRFAPARRGAGSGLRRDPAPSARRRRVSTNDTGHTVPGCPSLRGCRKVRVAFQRISRVPESAKCRSSTTSTTGRVRANRPITPITALCSRMRRSDGSPMPSLAGPSRRPRRGEIACSRPASLLRILRMRSGGDLEIADATSSRIDWMGWYGCKRSGAQTPERMLTRCLWRLRSS